jgi:hypothetical protein
MGGLVWENKITCLPKIKKTSDLQSLEQVWHEPVLLPTEEKIPVLN